MSEGMKSSSSAMQLGKTLHFLFEVKAKAHQAEHLEGCLSIGGSAQFSSVVQLCPTLCDPMNHSIPRLPVHYQLPESTQTHVHWVGDAIQPSHPLSSPSPPAFDLSQHQGLFKCVSSSYQVAKVLSFSFNISPSNVYSVLISFRMDWLDLCTVQRTFKSLLQHHSSKASILRCSAFFIVQLSHPYTNSHNGPYELSKTFVKRSLFI